MHFELEQRIDAPRDALERALRDPAYYAAIGDMPNLGTPEVLARTESGDELDVEVRYAFIGALSPAVRAVIDQEKVTWVIHTTFRLAEHTARFTVLPDHYRELLTCSGTYRFEESGGGTIERIEGNLEVRFPILGRSVERGILGGLETHVASEARVLGDWVISHP